MVKPGNIASKSGIYKETGTNRRVTVVKGEPMPPTTKPNHKYTIVVPTKKGS